MAHLITVQAPEKTYVVVAEHEDRAEAMAAARRAVTADSGYAHPFISDAQPLALPEPEFAPKHDLWVGPEEEADVGNLVVTVSERDVIQMTLPDGQTINVYLHDLLGRGRVMLRVEAPKTVRVRAQKQTEVEA